MGWAVRHCASRISKGVIDRRELLSSDCRADAVLNTCSIEHRAIPLIDDGQPDKLAVVLSSISRPANSPANHFASTGAILEPQAGDAIDLGYRLAPLLVRVVD